MQPGARTVILDGTGARRYLAAGSQARLAATATRPSRGVRVATGVARYLEPALLPVAAGVWLHNLALVLR